MAPKNNDPKFFPDFSWQHCEWSYRIVEIKKKKKNRKSHFVAELLILDEYDGYLMDWKVVETSPKFQTEEEAREFIKNRK